MRLFRFVNRFLSVTLLITLLPTPGVASSIFTPDFQSAASYSLPRVFAYENSSSSETLVQQTTIQATGPLFVNPDNPRYFTDGTLVNGKYKVIYLTGSHTWCNFMDCDDNAALPAKFDYTAYLNFLESKNHNFFRLWRAENMRGGENGDNFWFDPMPYIMVNGANTFLGNKKFDLNQFNQTYFDRMRQRIIQARDRGMYVSIMLFDGWSVVTKFPSTHQPWKGHPYNPANNINNIDGDVNNDNQGDETHTLIDPKITDLQEAYIRKVIDTVNDLDNVLYEISNESTGGTANREWQYHMINYIKDYEATKSKQHPVGMTVPWPNGSNTDLYNSPAAWVSLNGDLNNPPVATGNKVILADTDHLCGICGDRQWVWKSFTRGENPIFMDYYDNATSGRGIPFSNPNQTEIRNNLGYVHSYAIRMNLANMTPTSNTSLCSTGFCLRNAVANGAEYLVYRPGSSGVITVNLSAVSSSKSLNVEWFNPVTGVTVSGGTTTGGGSRSFTPPFSNDAVLYIYDPALSGTTFADVPLNHPYYDEIEILYANGYTAGCSTAPLQFCPNLIMDRAQAAVFMLRGSYGANYLPSEPVHFFNDDWANVPWAEGWAEAMFNEGLSAGCLSTPLSFCPYDQLTNAQAAVFGLRLKYGNTYNPPSATGSLFADLTDVNFWGTPWAEQAYADGLIPSCGTSGGKPLFCPNNLVSRGFGAYIIVRAKNLVMP